uniref:Uncharacterized protein n=1 Tax=Salvator merianae TaxID=96440 RepID=A0A8D0DT88_SALMN
SYRQSKTGIRLWQKHILVTMTSAYSDISIFPDMYFCNLGEEASTIHVDEAGNLHDEAGQLLWGSVNGSFQSMVKERLGPGVSIPPPMAAAIESEVSILLSLSAAMTGLMGLVRNLSEEATCPICLDYFNNPVTIPECGHNLCRGCLDRCCGETAEGRCPQCRKTFRRGNIGPNRQLANMVEIAKTLSLRGAEGKERICKKHREPKKLFCRDDKTLICVTSEEDFPVAPSFSHIRRVTAQADVHMDPETAHPKLTVSLDCKSVRWTETPQKVPDNPERFDFWTCVLGCEEFTAGRHFWEIYLQCREAWAVGVARKTVKRKGNITWEAKEGIWCMGKWAGAYLQSDTKTVLPLHEEPRKIRVTLNCEGGRLALYDADRRTLIYEFSTAPFATEKLHPYFFLTWKGQLSLAS